MKTVQLKLNKRFLDKIKDGYKWLEIRNKDLNIEKGDMIEFIDPEQGFKVGNCLLEFNVSILDKNYFLESNLFDKEFSGDRKKGYGLIDDDKDWLKDYLKDTEKVYIYKLDLNSFKSYSYNRFVYLLEVAESDLPFTCGYYWENKAVFKNIKKARIGLRAWKKVRPSEKFRIVRVELDNKNIKSNECASFIVEYSK